MRQHLKAPLFLITAISVTIRSISSVIQQLKKLENIHPVLIYRIVSMSYFNRNIPDKIFLFAWNHKKEILKKEKN
jgi:hypothetical protein